MSKEYIIISLFGYRSVMPEEKRNAFLKAIYDGVTINRPKCFEKFINNTKNKLWKEVKNEQNIICNRILELAEKERI